MPMPRRIAPLAAAILLAACEPSPTVPPETVSSSPESPVEASQPGGERCDNHIETGMALFGDLHVHTSFSFDAAANATGATPDDANAYARGEPIPFWPLAAYGQPTGTTQIDRPLDFLAVTDHGEFLGERALCNTEGSPRFDTEFCQAYRQNVSAGSGALAGVIFNEPPARIESLCGADGTLCRDYARGPWEVMQRSANEANRPCEFTSFIAYEYTGTPGASNYHRNVIFRSESVPALPVSFIEAPIDNKLWSQLDVACDADEGCDYLTIPHNTNLANGRMAPYRKLEPTLENKRAYASKRQEREPIMEIFQHKGASECVNGLGSVLGQPDELCDIEAVRHLGKEQSFASPTPGVDRSRNWTRTVQLITECEPGQEGRGGMLGGGCVDPTDFHRSGLLVGLKEEQEVGLNPVKLGVIASTDTHTATPGGVSEESWGGAVVGEATPLERLQQGVLTSGIDGNPGGLAGVWAQENTRDAVFDAMRRREVFGTSGPRIRPRLFAGWDIPADACEQPDRVRLGYDHGVPMGGDLPPAPGDGRPRLLAYAAKDPTGLDLQSLQVIKGWVDGDGAMRAEVITVAEAAEGAAMLCALFVDEAFDRSQSTYYYLRVVEPERPRWHTHDCARIPEEQRPAVCTDGSYPTTINEMAWTSPVWYRRG